MKTYCIFYVFEEFKVIVSRYDLRGQYTDSHIGCFKTVFSLGTSGVQFHKDVTKSFATVNKMREWEIKASDLFVGVILLLHGSLVSSIFWHSWDSIMRRLILFLDNRTYLFMAEDELDYDAWVSSADLFIHFTKLSSDTFGGKKSSFLSMAFMIKFVDGRLWSFMKFQTFF